MPRTLALRSASGHRIVGVGRTALANHRPAVDAGYAARREANNANRVVASANDYVTRTWACMINGTPCSAFGDGYSGTYFSNDGGQTWCCTATGPAHLGTRIPGVEHLTGGPYDAGGARRSHGTAEAPSTTQGSGSTARARRTRSP
jgi:hypothetical protein